MGYMDKPSTGTTKYAGAHGGGLRGDQAGGVKPAALPKKAVFEGRFGRMFPTVAGSSYDTTALTFLGLKMTSDPERLSRIPTDYEYHLPAAAAESTSDGEENSGIAAGYTYFGQFIDHDITFDPVSSLQGKNDPDALVDYRSPALDLDCLYGRGPADQPYMYEKDGRTFRLGRILTQGFDPHAPKTARDLPRFKGNAPDDDRPARALIGDRRNDENVIVSQLQGVFLRFHNRLAMSEVNKDKPFEEIQKLVRWHYQWAVLNDYLPTIVGPETMKKVWPDWTPTGSGGALPQLQFYDAVRKDAYIPIEFSSAAYRFGHSMVRPIYRLNTRLSGGKDPHPQAATMREVNDQHIDGRFFVFAGVQERGLNGFDEFPSQWAIDWSLFFAINGSGSRTGKDRVQPAYKIDTSIVNPLGFLPEFSVDPFGQGGDLPIEALQSKEKDSANPSNLAVRNLWRGNSMRLPSGQALAEALNEQKIPTEELVVGKAQMNDDGTIDENLLSSFDELAALINDSPLWYYVLAEANAQWRRDSKGMSPEKANSVPITLGPVGGRIVAETLVGLVMADKGNSYLTVDPNWKPTLLNSTTGTFGVADLVKYAMEL